MLVSTPHIAIWAVAALATLGVIVRPFSWPEAIWAVLGAAVLLGAGLIGLDVAWTGVRKGTDVYLFLIGMMLLAEVARQEGLFDCLAAVATKHAAGSATRLFLLVYAVGTVVTVFMSNDATAVVLTPAVAAAVKTAKVKDPLPYLFVCAFIANAASFVLPISNPANLVIYGDHMPSLLQWLPRFAVPSLLSIGATYAALRLTQGRTLRSETVESDVEVPRLSGEGKLAAVGIVATAVVLLVASGFDVPLGLPTAVCGGGDDGGGAAAEAGVALGDGEGHFLGGVAVGGRVVRAGGGAGQDGADPGDRGSVAGLCGAVGAGGGVGGRGGDRVPVQRDEQFAGRVDRGERGAGGGGVGDRDERDPDRRRSGAEPVDHGVVGDDPVAERAAPRGDQRGGVAVPEAWGAGNAAGAGAGDRRVVSFLMIDRSVR